MDEPTNEALLSRRSALRLLGGASLALIAGCARQEPVGAQAPALTDCVLIPEETAGPFGLDLAGRDVFFRTEIAEGHPGVRLALEMSVLDVDKACAPMAGARVDVWHCDATGAYSGFPQPGRDTTGETFCRGIQITGSDGRVSFQTIYPGWYPGRITHVHFQVFLESGLVATSQITFPDEVTVAVYAVEPYAARGLNTSVPSIGDDIVFADGTGGQLVPLSGDPVGGYEGSLLIGVGA
ncbi:MAG: dioxygenase family protein [Actinomycetota bacterium]